MGGPSAEREISFLSGNAVLEALLEKGVDAHAFDPKERRSSTSSASGFDRVFIALHGRFGEDGTVQGALETMGIPYTGSGVMASALAMDKWRTKLVWLASGIPTPRYRVVDADTDWMRVVAELGLPLIVKPAREGSTIGITKVTGVDHGELALAYAEAARHDDLVLVEEFVAGMELTASILGERALPLIRIEAPAGQLRLPQQVLLRRDEVLLSRAGCRRTQEREIRAASLAAFRIVGCRGWGRLDLILQSRRLVPLPRGEHLAGDDRPFARADGGEGGGNDASATFASKSCGARMWDDARQLNAVAAALALARRAALLAWGALAWVAAPAAVRVPRGRRARAAGAGERRASRGGGPRRADGNVLHDESRPRARVARPGAVGAQRRAAPAVAAAARRDDRGARAVGALERRGRSSMRRARCSSPTTTATCRSSTAPTAAPREVTARYREWSEALAPLALTLERIRLSPRGGWRLSAKGAGGALAIELGREEPTARLAQFVARLRAHDRRPRARRHAHRAGGSSLSQRIRGARARIPGTRAEEERRHARGTAQDQGDGISDGEGCEERDRRPRHRHVEDRRDRRRGRRTTARSTSSGSARSPRAASRKASSSTSRRRWRRSSACWKRRS